MQRNPADMASRMIQQYDKDGDQKLNAGELAAMLTAMRERGANRGQGPPQRPGMERGKPGQNSQGKGRRRQDNENAAPGGEKPKRPASE